MADTLGIKTSPPPAGSAIIGRDVLHETIRDIQSKNKLVANLLTSAKTINSRLRQLRTRLLGMEDSASKFDGPEKGCETTKSCELIELQDRLKAINESLEDTLSIIDDLEKSNAGSSALGLAGGDGAGRRLLSASAAMQDHRKDCDGPRVGD